MTFAECVIECSKVPELIAEFNRLTGCNLGQSANRTAIERMVDDATGHPGEDEADMAAFVVFVYEYIWPHRIASTGDSSPLT